MLRAYPKRACDDDRRRHSTAAVCRAKPTRRYAAAAVIRSNYQTPVVRARQVRRERDGRHGDTTPAAVRPSRIGLVTAFDVAIALNSSPDRDERTARRARVQCRRKSYGL